MPRKTKTKMPKIAHNAQEVTHEVRRSARIREHEPTMFDVHQMDAAEAAASRWPMGKTRAQRQSEFKKLRALIHKDKAPDDSSNGEEEGDDEDADDDDDAASEHEEHEEHDEDEEEVEEEEEEEEEEMAQDETDDSNPGRRSTRTRWKPAKTDVTVKPPQREHESWDTWAQYLQEYCEATIQVSPVQETMNRDEKNKRLKKTKSFKAGKQGLIPEEWDPYQRVHICTHSWGARNRGKGHRPRQFVRGTDCPFRFVVQAVPDSHGNWRLLVKNGLYVHNHPVTPDTYGTYPVARGVKSSENKAQVATMINVGAKRSRIYDFLLDKGEYVTHKDVDNIIARYQHAQSSLSDNDATAAEVAKFMAKDHENAATIHETREGHTGVVSLTTRNTRMAYARFPEYLMVDCTHKTNRYNYQLMTFMVMNVFGEGMMVQQSLIEANGDWHMDRAISHFKRVHGDKWKLLRVIMVDKDLNEIKILQSHFPEARIFICKFHSIKYLSEMCRKPVFGKISEDDATAIETHTRAMVYAESQADYNASREDLRALCIRLGSTFFDYVEKNWHTCQDMWTMHRRRDLPHFSNHTNNMLESWFGKFKDGHSADSSMAECVRAVLACERRTEKEYLHRNNRVGQNVNGAYDNKMQLLLRFTTHYVAGKLFPEYAAGVENFEVYAYDTDLANQVVHVEDHGKWSVSLLDYSCDCMFAKSMQLPCRHAIAYRKSKHLYGALIPLNRVDTRWTCVTVPLPPVRAFTCETSRKAQPTITEQPRQLTQADRYKEAVHATHLIANELADITDPTEFSEMLQFILDQWKNARERRRMLSSPRTDTEGSSPVPAPSQDSSRTEPVLTQTQPSPEPELDQTEPSTQLSQYSLWSEQVGDVPILHPASVRFQQSETVITGDEREPVNVAQSNANAVACIKVEKAKKRSRESSSDSSQDDSSSGEEAGEFRINLNPKARKTGRPKVDIKKRDAEQKAERVHFFAAQKARRELGVVTLTDLANRIERMRPAVMEADRLLSNVQVRFSSALRHKPKYARMKNPVLNADAFYLLPPLLLEACVKAFPNETVERPIDVDAAMDEDESAESSTTASATTASAESTTASAESAVSAEATADTNVEVVIVNGVDTFSRGKIYEMHRIATMKAVVANGVDTCNWLRQNVLPVVLYTSKTQRRKPYKRSSPRSRINAFQDSRALTSARTSSTRFCTEPCLRHG